MLTKIMCRDSIETALDEDAPGLLQVTICCMYIIYEFNNLSAYDSLCFIFFLACRFF
jgi:hypothetical protein